MIRTVIVDDEQGAIETLKALIEDVCSELVVVGEAKNAERARHLIGNYKPDLVFLDINMPNTSGISLVKEMAPFPSKVVFTTAFEKYAIEAIRLSAIDYLLKPVSEEDLLSAVRRFRRPTRSGDSLSVMNEIIHQREVRRIAVVGVDDIQIIDIQDISHISSDKNYSIFHLTDQREIVATKPLGEYEALLGNRGFFRVNRSVLVHLRYITKYIKGRGGEVLLVNGEVFEVSRTRKKILMDQLTES